MHPRAGDREADCLAGLLVGVQDRLAERAGAAIVGVHDDEGDVDLTGAALSGISGISAAGRPPGYVDAGQASGEAARPGQDSHATTATATAITGPLPTTAGATFSAQDTRERNQITVDQDAAAAAAATRVGCAYSLPPSQNCRPRDLRRCQFGLRYLRPRRLRGHRRCCWR